VNLRAVSGHRDTYPTDCPGNAAYRLLPTIANRVAQTGLPKLYAPVISGTVGGPVRFTARLSSFLPWTVTVTDAAGVVVANWSDIGTSVDWTWDSELAVRGAAYFWTISSDTTVRAATGMFGGKLAALTLTKLQVSPPALDGSVFPTATVAYTLSAAATVTAELVDASGVVVATLFSQSQSAGAQSFFFTPTGVPDGNYTIRVTARDSLGRQVQATVPVAVSHALLAFSAGAKIVSPNGDGRRDSVIFRFLLAQPAAVTLALTTLDSTFPLLSAQLAVGRQSFAFTGTALDGSPVPDGVYDARLTAGAVAQSLPLTIDRVPPTVSLVSVAPLRLRVAEHVTVIATINGRVVRASVQPGIVRLAKRQVVRTLRAVVRDAAGNESLPVTYRAK
jgi:flagellar hook assembly protein FlgD